MARLLPDLPQADPPLGDDMLYGVDEIAAFLKLDRLGDPERARKAVYQLRGRGKMPIFKLEGVGLAARKSSILAYIQRKDAEAGEREAAPRVAKPGRRR